MLTLSLMRMGKGKIGHPHDPSLLESGNILVFDNGMHVMGMAGSKVIEVDPGSGEIVWEYKASPPWNFFSGHISGAQRLPNGNTLICEGAPGRIFEVTPQKEVVWEYRNPFFHPHPVHGRINSIFRAYRYGPDFEGFRGKELDPSRWGWLNYAL